MRQYQRNREMRKQSCHLSYSKKMEFIFPQPFTHLFQHVVVHPALAQSRCTTEQVQYHWAEIQPQDCLNWHDGHWQCLCCNGVTSWQAKAAGWRLVALHFRQVWMDPVQYGMVMYVWNGIELILAVVILPS